jgi:hypothetical protein
VTVVAIDANIIVHAPPTVGEVGQRGILMLYETRSSEARIRVARLLAHAWVGLSASAVLVGSH